MIGGSDTLEGTPRSRRGLIFRLVFTALLIALVLSQVDLRETAATLARAQWLLLLAAVGAALAERVISTVRWWLLLRAKGLGLAFSSLLGLHMAASFAGSFLPTTFGADAVRIAMLARRTRRTVDCIAASVVDRAIMVFCTIAAAAVAATAAAIIMPQLVQAPAVRWLIAGAAGAALVAALLLMSRRLMAPAAEAIRSSLGHRLVTTLGRLRWGICEYRDRPRLLASCAMISVVLLLVRVMCTWLIALALGVDVTFAVILIALPIIAVVVMAPVSVGGFGVQEGAFVVLLGLAGVPAAAAISISLLEHVVVRLAAAPGMVYWLTEPGQVRTVESGDLFRMAPGGAGVRR